MLGAYGIALVGENSDHPSLPIAPEAWPTWEIAWIDVEGHVASGLTLGLNVGGYLDFHVGERRCVIATPDRPSKSALVHPWLATIGAWVANARGFDTFHAGGVVVAGRAWAVLGAKEAGKSTTLAAFYQAGYVVTSDDLVGVQENRSLSGPACVDLRQESAHGLRVGMRQMLMPGRVRWRLDMPAPTAEVPFAGFVIPAFTDLPACVAPVPPADRLRLLFDSRAALWRDNDRAARMLQMASLPMLRWHRPRSLAHLPQHVEMLVERLRDYDPPDNAR
jgi:hypothetical protein